MNINDFKDVELPQGDMLQIIFDRQRELEEKYGPIEAANGIPNFGMGVDIDNAQHQAYIKDAVYRCIEELSEFTNTLKNKPWKQTQLPTDRQHMIEEFADALHFFIRSALIIGLDAEDLAKVYFHKSEVNKFRQASKY